ncbi:MAG: T9SS type A sorting domain-containing protein [Salibacteraceae bacterium]|jgi:hypothetical protein|nr:T9SS type A sorting domain-containing protein [Salibacteraceae bacterium]MDP4685626.1 T9SS type A sorting domain-containing protein [Salibacteraceae bacterium]MDP4762785.1 T9SS type A sorting domain-containing protein [Salibacteraceae bacterium]
MKSILKLLFLFVGLTFSGFAQSQNLNTCLILDLPFDGSIADQGPNNYSTSSVNTIGFTTDRNGLANGAVLLNGVDDFITLNNNLPIINSDSFSISCWIKMNGLGGGIHNRNSVFFQRDDATGNTSALGINTDPFGTMRATARRSNSAVSGIVDSPSLDYGQWAHIVVTMHGDTLIFYQNGQNIGATLITGNGNYHTSIDYVEIGRHRNVSINSGFFNGAIDDFKIFDCVLSEDEILELYIDADVNSIDPEFSAQLKPLIFPNPTQSELFIEWPKVLDEDLTFSIIGMNGQVFYTSQKTGAMQHTLELGNLASGVYYLTIIGDEFNREFMIVKI